MSNLQSEPQFNLFDSRPTHLSIVSQQTEIVRPIYFAPRYPGASTFTIPASASHFTSSKIILKMVLSVKKTTAEGVKDIKMSDPDKDQVALVNNFFSSAFSTIQCTLNGRFPSDPCCTYTTLFAYRSDHPEPIRRNVSILGLLEDAIVHIEFVQERSREN